MNTTKMTFFSRTLAVSLITGVCLAGCGSSGSDPDEEPIDTQTTETETTGTGSADSGNTDTASETTESGSQVTQFDGTWRANCIEKRVFMANEEDQPGGSAQRMLTINSGDGTYTTSEQDYTDSECMVADPEDPVDTSGAVTGKIRFDGVITTSSGMEASVVYYDNGSSPELSGLLYRDGDVLYRELRDESTLIEDDVPVGLALGDPWQLVN